MKSKVAYNCECNESFKLNALIRGRSPGAKKELVLLVCKFHVLKGSV